jgi:cellulose synthase (UDP-forming)
VFRQARTYRRYLDQRRHRQRIGALFLAFLHVGAGVAYVAWIIPRLNLEAWYVTIPFFFAELTALLATSYFALTIRHPREHREGGTGRTPPQLSLDVWVTTAGEPLSILEPTVAAASRIRFPRKTVYLLDDCESDEVARLAAAYGCEYLGRKDHSDAKGGNLNYALERTRGDLLLVLDADQVPDANLMEQTGGYFSFPDVAFVQTAQSFAHPAGDPWGNADTLFYSIIQKSKDSDNAAFSCGSGVVYRRTALGSIGGFSTWNLVEDVHTSMRLHARGWKSIYHGYPLTTGTAPAEIVGYSRQRSQWAVDSLRMLFWDNPFRHRGLSFPQKLQYTYTGAAYLIAAFVLPFYFLLPVWSNVSGTFVIDTPAWQYAIMRGVYFAATFAMLHLLSRPTRGLKSFRFWAGMFPAFIVATGRALLARNTKPGYRVTAKDGGQPSAGARRRGVWPQASVIALVAMALLWGWGRGTLPTDALVVNSLWSFWILWTLTPIVREGLRLPGPPQAPSSRSEMNREGRQPSMP